MALITSDCDAMPYSPRIARFNQIKNGPMDFQVGHGLQLQPPMDNPYCSCKRTRVFSRSASRCTRCSAR